MEGGLSPYAAKDRMTKLIRKRATRAFLTNEGRWSLDPVRARRISDPSEATAVMHQLKLEGVELYYSFDDSRVCEEWDFAIPLDWADRTC